MLTVAVSVRCPLNASPKRVVSLQREEVASLRCSGMTMRKAACILGMSASSLRYACRQMGITTWAPEPRTLSDIQFSDWLVWHPIAPPYSRLDVCPFRDDSMRPAAVGFNTSTAACS